MKKLLTLTSVFLLSLALAGCFGGGEDYDMEDGEMEMEEEMAMEEIAYETMEYKVFMNFITGFEEDYAGFDMTLNEIIDGWQYPSSSPAAGVSPAAGMKHVLFNLDVNNPEDNEMSVGPMMNDFALYYGEDMYKPVWFLADSGRADFPSMVSVEPGMTATHDLLFEVPADLDIHNGVLKFESTTPSTFTPEVKLGELIELNQFG